MRPEKCIIDCGGDGEVIILLHGFLSSAKYWKRLQRSLSKSGYRVIAFDLLGFGNAPKPRHSSYTYGDHLRHINLLVESLAITAPFTLVGHSMGALLAARYGDIYKARVKSTVLLNPPLYKDETQAHATLRRTMLYRILLESSYRHYIWIALRQFHFFSKHTRYSRENTLYNIIESAEIFSDLQKTQSRTLVIVGRKDRSEYLSNLKSVTFSNSVSVMIDDINHHAPIMRPRLIQNRIVDFIS